jgi:hypothetical protein
MLMMGKLEFESRYLSIKGILQGREFCVIGCIHKLELFVELINPGLQTQL